MDKVEIGTLGNVDFGAIHAAWTRAFSDYSVNIQLTEELLKTHMTQNSFDPTASIGAFDGKNIVGLWLNGVREIDGTLCAYDTGTAVWPEYRGIGISKLLASKSTEILKKMGVKEYFLEVISDNTKAYNIYLKDGFKVTRTFLCFEMGSPRFDNKAPDDVMFAEEKFDESIINDLPPTESAPSWQNTIRSMLNVKETVCMITARERGKLAGYGLIQPQRGRISELGFAPDTWNTDIPSEILKRLCGLAESDKNIAMINVDESASKTIKLLEDHGFNKFVEQFEMKKNAHGNI